MSHRIESPRRVWSAFRSVAWLMVPEALDEIEQIVTRSMERKESIEDAIEAVAAKRSRYLSGTEETTIRDGVAIIPIIGPIIRRMDWFSEISGGASVDAIARDFNSVLANPAVKSILLEIDSPGGQANGIHELGQMIYQARNIKPIEAYVGGTGASAAFWLASAASRVTIDATALLGSVGVVLSLPMGADPKRPERTYVSSRSPNKRPVVGSDDGDAVIQKTIDSMADVFLESVARNRQMTVDQVVIDFNEGGLLVGRDAVGARMADALGSFEGVLLDLSTRSNSQAAGQQRAARAEMEEEMKLKDAMRQIGLIAKSVEPEAAGATVEAGEIVAGELLIVEGPSMAELQAKVDEQQRQIREMQHAQIAKDATTFARRMVTEAHIYSAELATVEDEYKGRALDDNAMPAAEGLPSRLEKYTKSIEARPKHKLLEEHHKPEETSVIISDPTAKSPDVPESRIEHLLSMSELGRISLQNGSAAGKTK